MTWQEFRKVLIRISRIWQYETYGPLIGPKTVEQERNVYEGVQK